MSNSKTEQLYEDFQYSNSGLDSVLETAVAELSKAIVETKDKAKQAHKRFSQFDDAKDLSDQIIAMFKEFGEKVSKGFNEASPKMQREMSPKFAEVCIAAMDMNPKNTKEVMKVVDLVFTDYEKNPQPDAEVYKTFQKIYASAFRNTGSMEFANVSNRIGDKVEMLNGNATPDKFLKRLLGNNPKVDDLHNLEASLQHQLSENPEQCAKDLFGYISEIAKIRNNALREQTFEIVLQNLKTVLEGSVKEASKSKPDMEQLNKAMFKIFEIEDVVGITKELEQRTPFERHTYEKYLKEMKDKSNQDKLAKDIYTLLNFPNEKLGVERKKGKSFYPSKKDMLKIANSLDQYKHLSDKRVIHEVDNQMITYINLRIDDKSFTNIDDEIIDKIMNIPNEETEKTPKNDQLEKLKENMTHYRAQMHAKGIKGKAQKAEPKTDTKTPPTNKIVFDISDIKDLNIDGKGR